MFVFSFVGWVQVGGSNYSVTSLFLYKIKEVHDYLIKVGIFVFCNISGEINFYHW